MRDQAADADAAYAGDENVGAECEGGARRIPAVGGSHDRDFFRIGDASVDEPARAVDQIVVHLAAPFLESSLDEFSAVACRGAVVHLQHSVAAVGEPLHRVIIAPAVARPRSAVY